MRISHARNTIPVPGCPNLAADWHRRSTRRARVCVQSICACGKSESPAREREREKERSVRIITSPRRGIVQCVSCSFSLVGRRGGEKAFVGFEIDFIGRKKLAVGDFSFLERWILWGGRI